MYDPKPMVDAINQIAEGIARLVTDDGVAEIEKADVHGTGVGCFCATVRHGDREWQIGAEGVTTLFHGRPDGDGLFFWF